MKRIKFYGILLREGIVPMVAETQGNAAAIDAGEMDRGIDLIDMALSRLSSVDTNIAPAAPRSPVLLNSLAPDAAGPKQDYNGVGAKMMQDFKSALKDTKVMDATEKLKVGQGALNAQSNQREGVNKVDDAKTRIGALHAQKERILHKADAAAPTGGPGGGLMGGALKDIAVTGVLSAVMPGAGALYAAASAAKTMMGSPSGLRSLEGLGTYSQAAQAAPTLFASSAPTSRGSRKNAALYDTGYGRSEPQSPAAPAPGSQAVWSKLQQGPGFGAAPRPGHADYLAERTDDTAARLEGITRLKLDRMIDQSETVRLLKGQKADGDLVNNIHKAREALGLGASVQQNTNIVLAPRNDPMIAPAP
jgi:hypothetical protein